YSRNWDNFPWDRNALNETGAIDDGSGSVAPRQCEKVVRYDTAQNEDRKMLLSVIGKNLNEYERQHSHHHQGVKERPKHPKGHVAIADAEILYDEVLEKVYRITVPHAVLLIVATFGCQRHAHIASIVL